MLLSRKKNRGVKYRKYRKTSRRRRTRGSKRTGARRRGRRKSHQRGGCEKKKCPEENPWDKPNVVSEHKRSCDNPYQKARGCSWDESVPEGKNKCVCNIANHDPGFFAKKGKKDVECI